MGSDERLETIFSFGETRDFVPRVSPTRSLEFRLLQALSFAQPMPRLAPG